MSALDALRTLTDDLERCRPWIESALEYSGGTHVFDDIVRGVVTGKMTLWAKPKGCIVTEIICFPQQRVLNVFLGGGEFEELADMHGPVIEWAKAQGCTAATISGREGWKRAFKNRGWKPMYVTLKKEFD